MFTLREQSAEFYHYNKALRKIVGELTSVIPVQRAAVILPRNHVIPHDKIYEGNLYLLKEGFLRCKRNDKLLFFVEPGDLVGLAELDEGTVLYADSDVAVDEYSKKAFFNTVRRDLALFVLWTKFISVQSSLYISLINEDDEDSRSPIPPADDNHELKESPLDLGSATVGGVADVFIGDTRLGFVLSREVFKALTLTAAPDRAAKFKNAADSVTVQIPKSHILALIKSHPHAVLKMLEQLSQPLAEHPDNRADSS